MANRITPATLITTALVAALIHLPNVSAAEPEAVVDVQNDEVDVTLFRGAANNSYFEVYFNALPTAGAANVEMQIRAVDLRPERDVTLHVEIYNPNGTIPLIITPAGNGDTNGFGGFARNVAAAALYGMSSGGRSNMIVASRYPEDIAALVIAPLTGGTFAATRLSEDYFLKYLHDEKLLTRDHVSTLPLESMKALGETPLWSAYLARNTADKRERFLQVRSLPSGCAGSSAALRKEVHARQKKQKLEK